MNYLKKSNWEIKVETTPRVVNSCSKCKVKKYFINTKNFRINANGSCIDVWLIYQCEKCKTTWKLPIYERVKPKEITRELYDKFMENDKELAVQYGFHAELHKKAKVELSYDTLQYQIIQKDLEEYCDKENEKEIILICKHEFDFRLEKILSEMLHISRRKVKEMCKNGTIYNPDYKEIQKIKVKNGMTIFIRDYLTLPIQSIE